MRKTLLMIALFFTVCQIWAARKALIIGNGAYEDRPLKNAVSDALLMQRTMQSIGFDTQLITNKDGVEMERAINQFARQIDSRDEVFFYYSGHAVQIDNNNYLIPIDEDIDDDISARRRGVALKEDVMERLDRARFLIIVLDACRDNPFLKARGGSRGLAVPPSSQKQYFILYSTGANDVADDGIGENSDFTRILAENIPTPGLELSALGRKVGNEVYQLNYRQSPQPFIGYYEDFYFVEPQPAESSRIVHNTPEPPATYTPPPQTYTPPPQTYTPPALPVTIPKPDATPDPPPPVQSPPPVIEPESKQIEAKEVTMIDIHKTPKIGREDYPPPVTPHPVLATRKAPFSFALGSFTEMSMQRPHTGYQYWFGPIAELNDYYYADFRKAEAVGRTENYIQMQYRKLWLRQNFKVFAENKSTQIADLQLGIPLYLMDLELLYQEKPKSHEIGIGAALRSSFRIGKIWTNLHFSGFVNERLSEYDLQDQVVWDVDAIYKNDNLLFALYDDAEFLSAQMSVSNVSSQKNMVGQLKYPRNNIALWGQAKGSFLWNLGMRLDSYGIYAEGIDKYVRYSDLSTNLAYKITDATELDVFYAKKSYDDSSYSYVQNHENRYEYVLDGFMASMKLSHTFDLSRKVSISPALGLNHFNFDIYYDAHEALFVYNDWYDYWYYMGTVNECGESRKKNWVFPVELNACFALHPNLSIDAKVGYKFGDVNKSSAAWENDPLMLSLVFNWQYRKFF